MQVLSTVIFIELEDHRVWQLFALHLLSCKIHS